MNTKMTPRLAVLLALFDLGGATRAVDTEDIAMRAAEILPQHFRWKHYPEQVNLELVRLTLKNAKQRASQPVNGGISLGWQLTPTGVRACFEFPGHEDPSLGFEVQRISSSKALATWRAVGAAAITENDVNDLLRVNRYFDEDTRCVRSQAFMNAASLDPTLWTFATDLRSNYPEVIRFERR